MMDEPEEVLRDRDGSTSVESGGTKQGCKQGSLRRDDELGVSSRRNGTLYPSRKAVSESTNRATKRSTGQSAHASTRLSGRYSTSSVAASRKAGSSSSGLSSRLAGSAYSSISGIPRLGGTGYSVRSSRKGLYPSTFSRWRELTPQSDPEGNDQMSCSGSSTSSENSKGRRLGVGMGRRVWSFQNLQKSLRAAETPPRERRRLWTPASLSGESRKRKLWTEPTHVHYGESGQTDAIIGIAQSVGLKDQDRYDVRIEEYFYLAVFDGHGESALAAEYCMDKLYTEIENAESLNGLPSNEAIVQAYLRLNERASSKPRTGACAATLFLAKPQHTEDSADAKISGKVAWAGDCRAILLTADGQCKDLTRDHRIGEHPSEETRIRNAEHNPRPGIEQSQYWKLELQRAKAEQRQESLRRYSFIERRKDPQGNAYGSPCIFAHDGGISLQITRSIGDRDAARSVIAAPEINDFEISRREYTRIVIASDGVFDAITSSAVAKFVSKYKDPQRAALKLVKHAKEKRLYGGKSVDDITAIVFDVNPSLQV